MCNACAGQEVVEAERPPACPSKGPRCEVCDAPSPRDPEAYTAGPRVNNQRPSRYDPRGCCYGIELFTFVLGVCASLILSREV